MFTIQELNNAQCSNIIDFIITIQQVELKVPVTLEAQPDLLDIDTFYSQPGGNFWGAYANNVLIGTIALIRTENNTGVIRKMFVDKEYRGAPHGVAQALLETLFSYCHHHHIETLYLGTIDVLKAAQRFYEKNGFARIDVGALPSYFPRMMADNTFYYLSLKK